jgi:hypothetical protein
MNVQPFSPDFANTKSISATSTSANVAIAAVDFNTGTLGQGYNVMRIVNAGPNTVFLRWGTASTTTALATDMPMLAGTVEVFTNSPDTSYVAAICASAQTATVYITCGEGQ